MATVAESYQLLNSNDSIKQHEHHDEEPLSTGQKIETDQKSVAVISETAKLPVEHKKSEIKSLPFWRDALAEFVATFALISMQAALPLTWGRREEMDTGSLTLNGLGMGFVVCVMVEALGDFGGAHMNPVVTISLAICFRVSMRKAIIYVVLQCVAGIVAAGFIFVVVPSQLRETLSATTLHPDLAGWQGFLIEVWITFILILTVLGSTNKTRKDKLFMPSIPIGFAVALGIMVAGGATGGSMNPARSFGPAVVMSIWKGGAVWAYHWVYWFGPMCGGLFASLLYSLCLDKLDLRKNREVSQVDTNDTDKLSDKLPYEVITPL